MCIVTRLPVVCAIVLGLPACVSPGVVPPLDAAPVPVPVYSDGPFVAQGSFDFDWQLAGDRAVAPLQVFSGDAGVWLQFAATNNLPAIFGLSPNGGERLLDFRIQAPYVYLAGRWLALRFRAGQRIAEARRATPAWTADAMVDGRMTGPVFVPLNQAPVGVVEKIPPVVYAVGPEDGNVRRALGRWAGLAGWTFEADHWTLAADIPITARAGLGDDFQLAVSALLASTEMADLPVQPCFYQNRVLRVIAFAQRCDPRSDRQTVALSAGRVAHRVSTWGRA